MSKPTRLLYRFLIAGVFCLQIFTEAKGQTADFKIVVTADARANVSGQLFGGSSLKHARNFSFERSAAGAEDLARRIENLQLFDGGGRPVSFRKLQDGEYLAEGEFVAWKYSADLSPMKNRMAAAHASWISGDRGVLMGADLLPLNIPTRTVQVLYRDGRVVYDSGSGQAIDSRSLIIPFGPGWTSESAPGTPLSVTISGAWNFSIADAVAMTGEIYGGHRKLFGADTGAGRVILSNFPITTPHGIWEAETRGSNVTIISSDMPFRTQSLQRLHEQLRHELFHLWIPNGVNLTGRYDWFYEGFALYQSLRIAVAVNRIRFEDFLDTLSRAHTIDSAQSQRVSLIQASATRSSGADTQVYARGMLVAFLSDVTLLQRSKGKRSVENLLRALYEKHRPPALPADGNTSVIDLLKSNPELIPIVDKYVTGGGKIEWTAELALAGIEDIDAGPLTTLRVKDKPSGSQKTVLDKLGYNNWRRAPLMSK